ncbi:TetR/AcrR family transcriptional regulator [Microbacterium rhizophilus]|uniref:TetR/AcrR family transcriptional regulator n=1 Tax=Microbacterium rhizophilus TaxID=3138934 RepID=UPI0031E909BB
MPATPRVYRSELRGAQAAATRAKVLDAAADEFTENGYSGTTLGAIAAAAGVSVETVKLQGAKHELLLAAWERRLGAPEDRSAMLDDPDFRAQTRAIPDDELIPSLVAMAADISRRSHGLWATLSAVSRTEPALRGTVESLQERRLAEFALLVEELDARGMLRGDQPHDVRAASIAFLASAEGYRQLVHDSGLSHEAYCAWLTHALERIVLDG